MSHRQKEKSCDCSRCQKQSGKKSNPKMTHINPGRIQHQIKIIWKEKDLVRVNVAMSLEQL